MSGELSSALLEFNAFDGILSVSSSTKSWLALPGFCSLVITVSMLASSRESIVEDMLSALFAWWSLHCLAGTTSSSSSIDLSFSGQIERTGRYILLSWGGVSSGEATFALVK